MDIFTYGWMDIKTNLHMDGGHKDRLTYGLTDIKTDLHTDART